MKKVKIKWPDNKTSNCAVGMGWLEAANDAAVEIPTGCLSGSCGACEIEINGEVVRACIASIPDCSELRVEFFSDPDW